MRTVTRIHQQYVGILCLKKGYSHTELSKKCIKFMILTKTRGCDYGNEILKSKHLFSSQITIYCLLELFIFFL